MKTIKSIKPPESQIQEVLYYLIKRKYIDRKQMLLTCNVFNLPENIRRLRKNHNVNIILTSTEILNKFKRKTKFSQYSLTNKKEAFKVYLKLQKDLKEKQLKLKI